MAQHCRHGVALDARDLHIPADGVARQPELVLQGDLRRILGDLQRVRRKAAHGCCRHRRCDRSKHDERKADQQFLPPRQREQDNIIIK